MRHFNTPFFQALFTHFIDIGNIIFFRIEHLEADTLKKLPRALFGQLQPSLIIITTPNSEFNEVFPDLEGFRHIDHKFEWTRKEFQNWYNLLGFIKTI